jgi:hypothetical protein
MKPQKRTQYSKCLAAEEIEEKMMEDESDEELELNEFTEPHENISSSSSGNEAEDVENSFRVRRPSDSPKVLDFTGLSPWSVCRGLFREVALSECKR